MFFADAVKALAAGEKLRRKAWAAGMFIMLSPRQDEQPGRIDWNQIPPPPGAHYARWAPLPWAPLLEDLVSSDWQIHVPRPGEPA